MKEKIRLKLVTESDYEFLYQLLSERDPRANISHRELPTFSQHVRFVVSRPYSKWYVITVNSQKAGSIYLTELNEIGIFLKKELQGIGLGNKALQLLIKQNPKKRYLANVSPSNKKSIEFFKKNGFKLIQYTYELRREKSK